MQWSHVGWKIMCACKTTAHDRCKVNRDTGAEILNLFDGGEKIT